MQTLKLYATFELLQCSMEVSFPSLVKKLYEKSSIQFSGASRGFGFIILTYLQYCEKCIQPTNLIDLHLLRLVTHFNNAFIILM
jgi:hypothetical protein